MRAGDAVETLRKRLVAACDEAVASIERRQRKDRGKVEWEEIRQRCVSSGKCSQLGRSEGTDACHRELVRGFLDSVGPRARVLEAKALQIGHS
jgi:hypothetical protein